MKVQNIYNYNLKQNRNNFNQNYLKTTVCNLYALAWPTLAKCNKALGTEPQVHLNLKRNIKTCAYGQNPLVNVNFLEVKV